MRYQQRAEQLIWSQPKLRNAILTNAARMVANESARPHKSRARPRDPPLRARAQAAPVTAPAPPSEPPPAFEPPQPYRPSPPCEPPSLHELVAADVIDATQPPAPSFPPILAA